MSALTATLLPAIGVSSTSAVAAEPEPTSPVALVGVQRAQITKYGNYSYGDLGLQLVAQGGDFEVRTTRSSWDTEPVTTYTSATGSGQVPRSMMRGFDRLAGFVDITIRDKAGKKVWQKSPPVCLNTYEPQRTGPDSPARSPYPYGCPSNPFTIGSVQGVAKGYANALTEEFGQLTLSAGRHKVVARMSPEWRELLGVAAEDAAVTYPLWVRNEPTDSDGGIGFRSGRSALPPNADAPEPQAQPGSTSGGSVAAATLADLKSLPAFGIEVANNGNYLNFAATVWNAGDSPLVVDGFRRKGEEMMDAYQYFYDTEGTQIGYQKVGAMHWHAAPSHNHWHFLDFARYSLLTKDKTEAVRSRKQSFCLANTDAVDYTVPGADWQPDSTDLDSACGERDSTSIRQVLSAGSGDTYGQYRAGQSFSLKGLENGQYWIAVDANPRGLLKETSTDGNRALRKVFIGGKPGKRTVRVAPVGLITSN